MLGALGLGRRRSIDAFERDIRSGDARAMSGALAEAAMVADAEAARARVIAAVVALLDREDAEASLRALAATTLADLDAREAVPQLVAAAEGDTPLVAEMSIAALGEIGDRRALEVARGALRASRPALRFQAIVAFSRIAVAAALDATEAAEPALLDAAWDAVARALVDEDDEVRARAADLVGELSERCAPPDRIADRLARLTADEDEIVAVRVAAAIALGEVGDQRGAAVLLRVASGALATEEPGRREAALEIAGELGLEAARPLASAAAFGWRSRFADPGRRASALVALAALGDERARAHFAAELASGSWARRTVAVGLIGRARLRSLRAEVAALANDETKADPVAVSDALERIDAAAGR
jgi:HEAT repeat protein